MSLPRLLRDARAAHDAVQLPCGHEVALGRSAILIELSAAILAHQQMCQSDASGLDPRVPFGGYPLFDPFGRLL
ncbi:MAG TPA: hypothetical protein VGU43_06300 [Thermoplasmata archaeon]|nr:hypothetical protein [Thermoplasmata archaeon]